MRRRLFLLALWLGGTAAATSVVFVAVARLSSDLASVGAKNDVPPGSVTLPSSTTTTSAQPLLVTLPATTAATTTTTVAPTSTAAVAPTTEPPAAEEPTVPEPRTGTTNGRTSPTASPRTTVAGPGPATTPATAAPTPATTPPPPVTTPAPTQPPPATTAPPSSCLNDFKRVGRAGSIFYAACADGIRLSSVTVASGAWSYTLVSAGPPTVTVTFTSGSTTLSCTIYGNNEGDGTIGPC